MGERRGTGCVFIPGEVPGLADEVGFDVVPDAAGGEGVTGVLNRKP